MNAIFTVVLLASIITIAVAAPESLLTALLNGAGNSVKTALTLFCIYAVWMGLSRLAEKSGLSGGAAKAIRPLAGRLFRTKNEEACENIAMNMACNLLGIGGAATPYAVKAIGALEQEGNDFAQKLLFVINATSIQIVPTTVIALRASAGSLSSADIFLPSLLCTTVSTLSAVLIFFAGNKLWRT